MNLLAYLRKQFSVALTDLTPKHESYSQLVRPTQDPKFGDYQANAAMPLAKEVGKNPRALAEEIISRLPDRSPFEKIEIAGPGFINLSLRKDFLSDRLTDLLRDPNLGIEDKKDLGTVIVDYSSPNVAKPMHVGHLRTTIIGDALARIYRRLGWHVLGDNHLGDWGTQFGMLIFGWRNYRDQASADKSPVGELARLYRFVNDLASKDPHIAESARLETAKLHEGDADNLALWNQFIPWCLEDLGRIYERLGIKFDLHLGESFYQPMLGSVVSELIKREIAEKSEGAICVFFRDPTGKVDDEGKPINILPPALIQKGDGAFLYITSDIACIRYRVETYKPKKLVYVVDDRQSLHFQQLFAIARKWGYTDIELEHVAFGKILGNDGKPFKTREGGTVGLEPLLDEAVQRARAVVDETSPDLSPEERANIAEVVGLGAVKYADLSQNRTSDYVFDWDKMISLQGNTSTYLQYAYARNRSIFRKGEIDPAEFAKNPPAIKVAHDSERALALQLLRFPETLEQTAADYKPNYLTTYLFELANAYSGFFRDCPVLKAEEDAIRLSRLGLCELTARTLKAGLELLGIQTVERM